MNVVIKQGMNRQQSANEVSYRNHTGDVIHSVTKPPIVKPSILFDDSDRIALQEKFFSYKHDNIECSQKKQHSNSNIIQHLLPFEK